VLSASSDWPGGTLTISGFLGGDYRSTQAVVGPAGLSSTRAVSATGQSIETPSPDRRGRERRNTAEGAIQAIKKAAGLCPREFPGLAMRSPRRWPPEVLVSGRKATRQWSVNPRTRRVLLECSRSFSEGNVQLRDHFGVGDGEPAFRRGSARLGVRACDTRDASLGRELPEGPGDQVRRNGFVS
jgi:hypothetical protein